MIALHHIAVSTTDLERCIKFYEGHFGAKELRRNIVQPGSLELDKRFGLIDTSVRIALLSLGDAYMEVFEFDNIPKRDDAPTVWEHGYTHFCFQVEDCWSEYKLLRERGVDFVAEPLKMPAGATFAYGLDPDGNVFELLEIPEDANVPRKF